MKSSFLSSLAAAVLLASGAARVTGAPQQNWTPQTSPGTNWNPSSATYDASESLSIDAINFTIPNGTTFQYTNTAAFFNTSDTLRYVNYGLMSFFPGAEFWTWPTGIGVQQAAVSFANIGTGIDGGVIEATGDIKIWADYITNSGLIQMDSYSLLQLRGGYVDLSRGSLSTVRRNSSLGSLLDGYWGISGPTNFLVPSSLLMSSPFQLVLTRDYMLGIGQVAMSNTATTYLNTSQVGLNTTLTEMVLVNNDTFSAGVTNYVFFDPFMGPVVEWAWTTTNPVTLNVVTNYVNISDSFGLHTNLDLVLNGNSGANPTYIPMNYQVIAGVPFGLPATASASQSLTQALIDAGGIAGAVTNDSTSYEIVLSPAASLPSDIAHGNVTNQGGRIEILANTLNLSNATLQAANYLLIKATNHFLGSPGANISAPYTDMYVQSTNGLLWVTNLIAPYVAQASGTIKMWSGRWTNVVIDPVTTIATTNLYHAFLVEGNINPTIQPTIQTCAFTVTNSSAGTLGDMFLSDKFNVFSNFTLTTRSLTLTTNPADTLNPCGQLNYQDSDPVWPSMTPGLQYLTNFGIITANNDIYFGGSLSTGYNDGVSQTNVAYQTFVNQGMVSNTANHIWTRYFVNSGTFTSSQDGFDLNSAEVATLTNGSIIASNGPISLSAGSLLAASHLLLAGGPLVFDNTTNILSDGVTNLALLPPDFSPAATMSNANVWLAGAGVRLNARPVAGDLLGTTVYCPAPAPQRVVPIIWAAEDRGIADEGFFNNAALGRLILDSANNPGVVYEFKSAPNYTGSALYVDNIELRGTVTNVDSVTGLRPGLVVDSNMRVYFAQATANGVSIAEKLGQQTGGHFIWVSNYNYGYFSSTNAVVNGTTNRVNTAMYVSKDLAQPTYVPWTPAGTDVPALPVLTFSNPGNGGSGSDTNTPGTTNSTSWTKFGFPGTPSVGSTTNLAGNYAGLFADATNGVSLANAGYISLNANSKGSYSGKLLLQGKGYSFSGKFVSTNTLATNLVRLSANNSLTLVLALDLGGDQIQGTLSSAANWTVQVQADRLVYSSHHKAAAASYTLILPPDTNSVPSPAGYGIGSVKVTTAGKVSVSGSLADGTKFSQGTQLSKDSYWPLFGSLYSGKGLLLSWVMADPLTNGAGLSGQVAWLKNRGASLTSYPLGFTNLVDAQGSLYSASTKAPVLNLSQGQVVLTNSLKSLFQLDSRSRATSSTNQLKLSFTLSTGLFSGSINTPSFGKVTFQGAVLQNTNLGLGYFIQNAQSGPVEISVVR